MTFARLDSKKVRLDMAQCFQSFGSQQGWRRSISVTRSQDDAKCLSISKRYGFSHDFRFLNTHREWFASMEFLRMVFIACFQSRIYDSLIDHINGDVVDYAIDDRHGDLDIYFDFDSLDPEISHIPDDYARVSFYSPSVLDYVNLSRQDELDEALISIRRHASIATHNWDNGSIWLPAVSPDDLRSAILGRRMTMREKLLRSKGPVFAYAHEIGHSLGYREHSSDPGMIMSGDSNGQFMVISETESVAIANNVIG